MPEPLTPKRVQRRRSKGWRMPPNTSYVGRPTQWGNPGHTVEDYLVYLLGDGWGVAEVAPLNPPVGLRGRNLACWCPPNQACHSDALLEIANA